MDANRWKRYIIKYQTGPVGGRNWRIWDKNERKFIPGKFMKRQATITTDRMNREHWGENP
jgi:hypothetical protein